MGSSVEVMVFGDEEGTAEACRETGARHLPGIACNEFGTPLLNHAFRVAATEARNEILCYVNSDILLFPGLFAAVQAVSDRFSQSMIVGRRWNFDVKEPFVFENNQECLSRFRVQIKEEGEIYDGYNIDYFIYPRLIFAEIPPFAVGRPGWDNWMIYEARRRQIPVIDATDAIFAAHQNHDYAHTQEGRSGGKTALWRGVEAEQNRELAGGHMFDLSDATHRLDGTLSLQLIGDLWHWYRRLDVSAEIYPRWKTVLEPLRRIVRLISRLDDQVRLFLLRRGIDLFPNKAKRRPVS